MHKVTILAAVMVVVGVMLTAPLMVRAADPDPVGVDQPGNGVFCLEAGDGNGRAIARATCDSMAQAEGYDHGVLLPCDLSSLSTGLFDRCRINACPAPQNGVSTQRMACAGVPGQN